MENATDEKKTFYFAVFIIIACVSGVWSQTKALSAEDYARAEKMLSYNTSPLVDRNGVRAMWLSDGRFWYQIFTPTGREYVLVNPADGSRKSAANLNDLGISARPMGGMMGRRGGALEVASPDGKKLFSSEIGISGCVIMKRKKKLN